MSTPPRKYVRRSREQWAELIELQPGSGLNVSQFCQHAGVSYQSFINWRKKLGTAPVDPMTASGFIELTAAASADDIGQAQQDKPAWLIELDLGQGVQLRIARA